MEGGGALAALQAMKAHPQEAGVQVGLGTGRRGRMQALAVSVPIPPQPSYLKVFFLFPSSQRYLLPIFENAPSSAHSCLPVPLLFLH